MVRVQLYTATSSYVSRERARVRTMVRVLRERCTALSSFARRIVIILFVTVTVVVGEQKEYKMHLFSALVLVGLGNRSQAFTVNLGKVPNAFCSNCRSETSLSALSLTLEKPLGLILEEVEEGSASGVKVEEIGEGGSAASCGQDLIGRRILRVGDTDVSGFVFDDVMGQIIEAPSPVVIEFDGPGLPSFEVGTDVEITVIQEGKETMTLSTKVGDNLRKVLLDNKVELYRGIKKKLGNCGGGGQCTFCAVDFVEEEGWEARSEYEDTKIAKYPSTVRLACLNNIQGPATIRVE